MRVLSLNKSAIRLNSSAVNNAEQNKNKGAGVSITNNGSIAWDRIEPEGGPEDGLW